MEFRVLTVRQPWAAFMFPGMAPRWGMPHIDAVPEMYAPKNVENRTWKTNYRGPLLIHTSEKVDDNALAIYYVASLKEPEKVYKNFVLGAIIGCVDLVDCRANVDSPWAIQDQNQFILENPISFLVPIFCKGKRRLWRPSKDILDRVWEEIGDING